MRKKAIIFGTASFAEVVNFYLIHDSDYEVVAITATSDAIKSDMCFGLPLIPFDEIEKNFPPEDCMMFIAVGYRKYK